MFPAADGYPRQEVLMADKQSGARHDLHGSRGRNG
jgi:hypothetical protein